jgi:hypothetical protein
MKWFAMLTIAAVAACLAGCEAIVLDNEKGPEPSTQKLSLIEHLVDPYEPDSGGQYMTPSAPQYTYYHTIYPADDVDFRYMQSVGAYAVNIQPARAALRVRVWTRAQKLHGPSTLVADSIAGTAQPLKVPFTLTNEQSFVVVRVEGTPSTDWTVYWINFVPEGAAQSGVVQWGS